MRVLTKRTQVRINQRPKSACASIGTAPPDSVSPRREMTGSVGCPAAGRRPPQGSSIPRDSTPHRMLGLVGQVRPPVFHLRDSRIRIVRMGPFGVRRLLRPGSVEPRQLGPRRRRTRRDELDRRGLERGKQYSGAPDPGECVDRALRSGYLEEQSRFKRIRRPQGEKYEEIVNFVKGDGVSPGLRGLLNALCSMPGCRHE